MRRVLPRFNDISEFPTGDVPWFADACGPDAILVGMNALSNVPLTDRELYSIRQEMIAKNLFRPGGCTLGECRQYVLDKGYRIVSYVADGSNSNDIHTALKTYAGLYPSVVFLMAAHNLVGTEGGVNGHFVDIGGIDSILGYWTANGDDVLALASAGGHGKIIPCRWQTWDVLSSAAIDGVFFFDNGSTPNVSGIPAGWADDGTTLVANGHNVVLGFRKYILSNPWDALDVPLEDEHHADSIEASNPSLGPGQVQTFRYSRLAWSPNSGVVRVPVGAELLADGK